MMPLGTSSLWSGAIEFCRRQAAEDVGAGCALSCHNRRIAVFAASANCGTAALHSGETEAQSGATLFGALAALWIAERSE